MSIRKETLYKLFTAVMLTAYVLHASSCASTKAAPTGGPKDTIPPVVTNMLPAENNTHFPLEKGEIIITFNEYVQVKDANKNILLSPPAKKNVKTRIKGKSVIITPQEALDTNTTYSLSFGQAIVDNNEGNPLYGLTYSFSTGDAVDSMMLSGTVLDAQTLFPIENATVALYLNAVDSTAITTRPDAVARSDKWGYFTLKNLKPLPYYVFAYTDGNTNNRYDQGTEQIAFLDTVIVPSKVMGPDSPELKYYDPKDTTGCLSRPSEIELLLFQENSTIQFIRDYKRSSRRTLGLKFNAPDVIIDSLDIDGIEGKRLIKQYNITNDSLTIWIKGSQPIDDTLMLGIKYHKSDSTGKLVPQVEKLKMVAPFEKKGKNRREGGEKQEERKDLLKFQIYSDNKKVEQEGIQLEFPYPLEYLAADSITFKMKTPKLVESDVKFSIVMDSLLCTCYTIKPEDDFIKGNDYTLTFPKAVFKDINGHTNDSTSTVISLPTDENLSSITLELKNVNSRYIVELVNPQRTQVFRKYIINEDTNLLFPYLAPGEYSIRITEDKNNNGIIDTGDYLTRRQPEKVLLFKLEDGTDKIKINERTDLIQDIDIAAMFGK